MKILSNCLMVIGALLIILAFPILFNNESSYTPIYLAIIGGVILGVGIVLYNKYKNNNFNDNDTFTSTFIENFDTLPSQQVITQPTNLDELKKLKDLLDTGAITQDEYNTKKKQLLNS